MNLTSAIVRNIQYFIFVSTEDEQLFHMEFEIFHMEFEIFFNRCHFFFFLCFVFFSWFDVAVTTDAKRILYGFYAL